MKAADVTGNASLMLTIHSASALVIVYTVAFVTPSTVRAAAPPDGQATGVSTPVNLDVGVPIAEIAVSAAPTVNSVTRKLARVFVSQDGGASVANKVLGKEKVFGNAEK